MTENDEITPEELPEEEAVETPADDGMMEIEVDGKEILTEVPVETADIPHHPAASLSETPDEPIASEEEIAEVKEPSKFQLFLRRTLTWFLVVAVFFAAGFATFYFVIHQPKVADLEGLQAQVITLEDKIEQLEMEKDQLEADSAALGEMEKHQALLTVMVDAYDARHALGEENTVAAKSALTGTDAVLEQVLDDIRSFDSGLADTLPQRLELIRTNIDRDVETAIDDCNQLIEDLLAVQEALYP